MNHDLKILGIVPARGGSKSVPRKNIKLLGGLPLIAYSIIEAGKAGSINRCIVSTEDDEIAKVAAEYGAEVPFRRPVELAMDKTTDLPVFEHCLDWLKTHEGYVPDLVVHLRPTAPFRTAAHIDQAVSLLLASPEADSVRSVCLAGQHPLKMWGLRDGWLASYVPSTVFGIEEAYNQPRQALPTAYIQNGSVDVIRTPVITARRSMSGRRILGLVMDELDSVNIDSPLDWALAETLMQQRLRQDAHLVGRPTA